MAGLVLAVLAAALVVWSFGWVATRPLRQDADLADKTEISILHWGDRAEDEIVESLIASCEAEHPNIKIKRMKVAWSGYDAKLQTMIAGGNPPDLFFYNSHMLPNFGGKDAIRPIEDYLEEDRKNGTLPFDFDDLYPVTVDSFRFDGKVTGRGKLYALPTTFTPLGFFYNKKLFDEAGVAYPTDNWTWDEFEEKARAIGKLEGRYGSELTLYDNTVRLYLQGYGLDFYSDGFEQLHLTDPPVLEALGRLRQWQFGDDAGRMLTSAKSMVNRGQGAFIAGKIGMFGPVGRWVCPNLRKVTGFDWDFAQMPRGPKGNANLVYVAAWCMSAESKHPREAWKVVKHFARPECQAISSRYGLVLPTLRSVAKGPDCCDPEVKPSRDDLFLEAVSHSTAMQQPAEPEFIQALNTALNRSLRVGTATVPDAMARAENEWQMAQGSPLRGDDFAPMPWRKIVTAIGIVLAAALPAALFFWWRRRPRGRRFGEELTGLAMISPWVIGLLVFIVIPMVLSLLLAFTKWSGAATLDHAKWVGTKNWTQMLFHDPKMVGSLWVTFYYVALMVPLSQITALGVAMLMGRDVRGIGVYRSVWYLPTVLAGVGMAVMWLWVFDTELGLLNMVLGGLYESLGINAQPPDWFGTDIEWFGVPAFVIIALWTTGGSMLIYLAGLQAIPKHLYEAARIDGAGRWAQFRRITVPMLSPIILFNVIMAIIGSFQVFTQAYVMTNGQPDDATRFYVLYLYDKAFSRYEMGYASAMAWLLFVVILALTVLTLRSSRRRVHYEDGRAAA